MNANKQDAGGLPELPEIKPHDHPDCHVMRWNEDEIRWIKRYARAYGELCRAAPAGGVYAHPGEIEAARRNLERGIGDGLVTVSVKPVPGYVALDSAPAGGDVDSQRRLHADIIEWEQRVDAGEISARELWSQVRPSLNALRKLIRDSAPAGSGEVLTDHGVKALDRCCGELRKFIELAEDYDLDEMSVQALQTAIESMELRKSAALLRKLQQGAE